MVKPHHLREWQQSCVAPKLIELNVLSLEDDRPWDYLFYSNQIERLNSGRLPAGLLKAYQHIEAGGWWCSGLDPLDNWEPMLWGRFKPNSPRLDFSKGDAKTVKYESPIKAPARLTYFRISLQKWRLVAARYQVAMPESVTVLPNGEAIGFWAWVQANPQIPVLLTEGEKKAACLLSLGYAAIALPGIWMGTRKSGSGQHHLHSDLLPMVSDGSRRFIILFDHETKPKTAGQVRKATIRLGTAIAEAGGIPEVALLPGPDKGIDDWVANLGKRAARTVQSLLEDALSLADYKALGFTNRCRGLHRHKPSLIVNAPYLSSVIQLPSAGSVFLVARMGGGKTTLLENYRKAHPGDRFLNNGHRITLLKNLAARLKTAMYSSLGTGELHRAEALSITADSLYKLADHFQKYGCIFIDECCQYLAHILLSKTCKDHQAEILDTLEMIIYSAPLVVFADAHLDDLTIDFFMAMRPPNEQPFIIQNVYQAEGRETYWYTADRNDAIIAQVCAEVLAGKRAIIVSDSKKLVKKLELMLNGKDPDEAADESDPDRGRPRVWAIHSDNAGSEDNAAKVANIRYSIRECDVMIASPTLGTGVDLPDYWFDVIFGIFHGATLAATDCLQMLWRYRPNVAMHVWVAPYPPFGYRPINASKIKQQMLTSNKMTAFLIRWNKQTGARGAEKDWALNAYCQLQAQRNFSLNNLRQDVRSLLLEMGCELIEVATEDDKDTKAALQDAAAHLKAQHCQAVANANEIDRQTYDARQSKDYLEPQEVLECERFRISDAYGLPVTPELVELDEGGKLIGRLIALEELLAEVDGSELLDLENQKRYPAPPTIVTSRDEAERQRLPFCFHWRNRSSAWLARHALGLREIVQQLFAGKEFTAASEPVQQLQQRAVWAAGQVKAILGTTIPPDAEPVWVLAQMLQQMGLGMRNHKVGARGEQVRHYALKAECREFALQVLDYRLRRRQEQEQRRQEDIERNAAHAETLARIYGIGLEPAVQPVSTPPADKEKGTLWGGVATAIAPDGEAVSAPLSEPEIAAGVDLLQEAEIYGTEAIQEIWASWTAGLKRQALQIIKATLPDLFKRMETLLWSGPDGYLFW